MHLVYLIFLLYLSPAACAFTSWNHNLLPAAAAPAGVRASAPWMTTGRRLLRDTMHSSSSSYNAHVPGPSPSSQPGVNLARDAVEEGGVPPAEQKHAGMPSPPPAGDGGDKEAAGGIDADADGAEGGSSDLITNDQRERDAVDIGTDYVPPQTHPPSHN